jgi:hypothetical protein
VVSALVDLCRTIRLAGKSVNSSLLSLSNWALVCTADAFILGQIEEFDMINTRLYLAGASLYSTKGNAQFLRLTQVMNQRLSSMFMLVL